MDFRPLLELAEQIRATVPSKVTRNRRNSRPGETYQYIFLKKQPANLDLPRCVLLHQGGREAGVEAGERFPGERGRVSLVPGEGGQLWGGRGAGQSGLTFQYFTFQCVGVVGRAIRCAAPNKCSLVFTSVS